MKIRTDIEQNSLEWLCARAGLVTASEADALISPTFKIRESKGVESYLDQKLAEKWVGGPIEEFSTLDMDFGKILEEEALPFYEFEFGEKVNRVALITDDAGRIGCSPDGLIGDDGGIEIKCPKAKTHIGYLRAGEVPADYILQVHFSMFVTGRKWWKFMSYRRRMPPLVKVVERDEKIQGVIGEAVAAFLAKMDTEWARLVKMNGGEPKRVAVQCPLPKIEPLADQTRSPALQ
jgi:predicted phage-related endonuclease